MNDEHTGRCAVCGRAWPRRMDGTLIAHAGREQGRCEGSGQAPAEDMGLPILPGVTPHGLRHGLQTWMDHAVVLTLEMVCIVVLPFSCSCSTWFRGASQGGSSSARPC